MTKTGVYQYRLYDLTVAGDTELSLTPETETSQSAGDDWWFEIDCVEPSSGRLIHDVADYTGEKRLQVRIDEERGIVFSHGETRVEWDSARRRIRLEPGDDADQRLGVILERVVAPIALIWEREPFVALHASAVLSRRGAEIFVGDSGAGKSTTALELMRRGREMLADDLVMIDTERTDLLAATPTVRLFDTPEDVPEAVDDELVMPNREKFWYRLPERDVEVQSPDVTAIYSLEPDPEVDAPAIERVLGREATVRVVGQAFDLTDADGDWRADRFRTLCKLARNIPVYRLVYSPDDRNEPTQVGALIDHISDREET